MVVLIDAKIPQTFDVFQALFALISKKIKKPDIWGFTNTEYPV